MEAVRIIVAMSNDTSIGKLRGILTECGYKVIEQAKDGQDCMRKIRTLKPDIAILDFNVSSVNGYEVAKIVLEDDICDVILIATEVQKELLDDINSESELVCMTKPINKTTLINTIDLMVKSKRKIRKLQSEINELRNTLDTRKEVEKAKGLLMKHLELTESEAFKRIQKQSMDKGIPMKEIARAIILAYDV
ncbi:MAG: ANTAR domain-containing response regulator [Bacillota bacterium]